MHVFTDSKVTLRDAVTRPSKRLSSFGSGQRETVGFPFFSLSVSRYFGDKETLCLYWPLGTVVITGPKALDFYAGFCAHRATSVKRHPLGDVGTELRAFALKGKGNRVLQHLPPRKRRRPRYAAKSRSCKQNFSTKRGTGRFTKEVVGIHVPLTRSLFGDGTPRRLLRRVSLTKSTSAPLRC
jgi:hypothetical protein